MGVSIDGAGAATEPIGRAFQSEPQELLHIKALVHPDGADARLTLQTTEGRIELTAPLERVAVVHVEMRSASALMHYRSSMKKDGGEAAFDALLSTAMRPVDATIIIDPVTGDRSFVFIFDDRLPVVIRLTSEMADEMRHLHYAEIRRTAN